MNFSWKSANSVGLGKVGHHPTWSVRIWC